MRQKRRLLLNEERVYIGSYSIVSQYYDNDDLEVSIYDGLGELIEVLWVTDEDEDIGFNMN